MAYLCQTFSTSTTIFVRNFPFYVYLTYFSVSHITGYSLSPFLSHCAQPEKWRDRENIMKISQIIIRKPVKTLKKELINWHIACIYKYNLLFIMRRTIVPIVLWYYYWQRCHHISCVVPVYLLLLDGALLEFII